jgi:hypothetical protein
VVKAVAGDAFSLTVFGFAQVAMDVEPLVRLFRLDAVLHGFSHTYLGATLIGILSLVAGRPVCQRMLDAWTPDPGSPFLKWLRGPRVIRWPAAVSGAFLGAYTHVLLDSMIHSDVRPFSPFWHGNPLEGQSSFEVMHLLCVAMGILSLPCLWVAYLLRRKRPQD